MLPLPPHHQIAYQPYSTKLRDLSRTKLRITLAIGNLEVISRKAEERLVVSVACVAHRAMDLDHTGYSPPQTAGGTTESSGSFTVKAPPTKVHRLVSEITEREAKNSARKPDARHGTACVAALSRKTPNPFAGVFQPGKTDATGGIPDSISERGSL